MTHFEFVSVAVSLILALAIADILRAIVPAARPSARYGPHLMWLVAMFLLIAYSWWAIWNVRNVSWTGLLFVYVLVNPALLTIATRMLTDRVPTSVEPFRDLFHNVRRPFFLVVAVLCGNGFIGSWVFDATEFGTVGTLQAAALVGIVGAFAGTVLSSDRAHFLLAGFAVLLLLAALVLTPVLPGNTAPAKPVVGVRLGDT